ncbi:MAG: hypothetical protein ABC596_05735 [Candidatus Methanosuratincola petrocarbonis]
MKITLLFGIGCLILLVELLRPADWAIVLGVIGISSSLFLKIGKLEGVVESLKDAISSLSQETRLQRERIDRLQDRARS